MPNAPAPSGPVEAPAAATSRPPAAGGPAYWAGRAIFDAAVRVYFRRVEVRDLHRVPRRGPLIIVANHPAAMTDALVLATRLPRRICFLAMSPLFRPWIRGALMRSVGALPVYRREDDAALTAHNEDTFAACHALLDRGGAVMLFPEGRSVTDRQVLRLKTGAARMAIAQQQRAGPATPVTLLPVGLYFEDRTRFQSEVIVSVGEPIPLAGYVAQADADPRGAVVALTGILQGAIESLIQVIPEPRLQELVAALERVYLDELRGRGDPRHPLELRQRIAACVVHHRAHDPERVVAVARQFARYLRKLQALRLEDAALRELSASDRWRRAHLARTILACVGFPIAVAGVILHGVPYETCGWIAQRAAPHPERVSSLHIAAGVLIFPPWLLSLGVAGWKLAGGPPVHIALVMACAALVGALAAVYMEWYGRQPGLLRLPWLSIRRRRLLVRIHVERRELIRVFDKAREDFLLAETST